jgi:hypothetical protein
MKIVKLHYSFATYPHLISLINIHMDENNIYSFATSKKYHSINIDLKEDYYR